MELNRGPFVAAQPEPLELHSPPEGAQVSTSAPSRRSRPATTPARSASRSRGRASERRRGSSSTAARSSSSRRTWTRRQLRFAVSARSDPRRRRLRARGRPGDARARLGRAARRALERGAELIDVREKDERDTGYIAGSRNIPYRLLALGAAELPRDRPIVTICETVRAPRSPPASCPRADSTRTRWSTADRLVGGCGEAHRRVPALR